MLVGCLVISNTIKLIQFPTIGARAKIQKIPDPEQKHFRPSPPPNNGRVVTTVIKLPLTEYTIGAKISVFGFPCTYVRVNATVLMRE